MNEQQPRDQQRTGSDRPHNGGGDRPNNGGGDRPNNGGGDRPNNGGGDRPNNGGGDRPNNGGGDRHGGNRQQTGTKSEGNVAQRALAFIQTTFGGMFAKGNGAKKSNGVGLSGRIEHLFVVIADALGMILLLLYGPVLVYVAAIAFVPKDQATTLVALPLIGDTSWPEIIAWVVTILFTSVHVGMKRVPFNLRDRDSVVQTFKLGLRSILLSVGWIYFYFGNPWSTQPDQFAMPELSLLLDPVFVTIWILILVDTWAPTFVRKQLID